MKFKFNNDCNHHHNCNLLFVFIILLFIAGFIFGITLSINFIPCLDCSETFSSNMTRSGIPLNTTDIGIGIGNE